MTKFVSDDKIKCVSKLLKKKRRKEMNCKELVEVRKKAIDTRLKEFQNRHTFDETVDNIIRMTHEEKDDYSIVDDIVKMAHEIGTGFITATETWAIINEIKQQIRDDGEEFKKLISERIQLERYGTIDMSSDAVNEYYNAEDDTGVEILEVMRDLVGVRYEANAFVQYCGKLYKVSMNIDEYGRFFAYCMGYADPSDLNAFTVELLDDVHCCILNGIEAQCRAGDDTMCMECPARKYSGDDRFVERYDVSAVAKTFTYMYMVKIVGAADRMDELAYAEQHENVPLNNKNLNL